MKKAVTRFFLLLSFLFLLAFCFSACKSPSLSRPVTAVDLLKKPFSCKMGFTIVNQNFTAQFSKLSDSEMDFQMLSPQTVSGLNFHGDSKNITISINGIGIAMDKDKLPTSSAGEVLFSLYGSDTNDVSITMQDGSILMQKPVLNDKVTIVFDKKTLVPSRLYLESGSLEMTYSDYQLLDQGS